MLQSAVRHWKYRVPLPHKFWHHHPRQRKSERENQQDIAESCAGRSSRYVISIENAFRVQDWEISELYLSWHRLV